MTDDKLFDEVVEIILKQEYVSIPFLQRRFAIGYSRASRIMTQLEGSGYIKRTEGSRMLKVIKGN